MCLLAITIALHEPERGRQCSRQRSESVPCKRCRTEREAPKRDSWVYDKEQGNLIRIHVCERKGFFNPNGVKECPVDLALFAPTRTATMRTMRGKQHEVFHRNWRKNKLSRAPTGARWTGQTVFKILDEVENRQWNLISDMP